MEMAQKKELLYDGVYYDITHWIKKHPGGDIIELYVTTGEDCALAAEQFHYRSTKKVMNIMKSLPHRKSKEGELNEIDIRILEMDPVKQAKWRALTEDFMKLHKEFETEGYFTPDPWHVYVRISEIILIFALGLYIVKIQPQTIMSRAIGILIMAIGLKRCAWVQHEGGHHSLLGNPNWDKQIQTFLFGMLFGLSGAYWRYQHTRHHAMTQHIEHDIDLDSLPLIAFNKGIVKHPKDGKTFLIQNQKWMILLCDTFLIGAQWKFKLHPLHCIFERKYLDLFYMLFNLIFITQYVGIADFLLALWLSSLFTIFNGILPHSFLPATNEPVHWVESGLIHSSNMRSSWWVDWWTGYSNYQIEHHLFPAMPQYRLNLCRDRVKALAKKHDLPYNLFSYWESCWKCLQNLDSVAKELARN